MEYDFRVRHGFSLFVHLFRSTFFAFAILMLALPMQAQIQEGQITGLVTDASGAVIRGANVKAVALATNQEYAAITGSNGEFVMGSVPFGFYKVSVSAKGFSTTVFARVQVNVSQTSTVNAKLNVASVGTEIGRAHV